MVHMVLTAVKNVNAKMMESVQMLMAHVFVQAVGKAKIAQNEFVLMIFGVKAVKTCVTAIKITLNCKNKLILGYNFF